MAARPEPLRQLSSGAAVALLVARDPPKHAATRESMPGGGVSFCTFNALHPAHRGGPGGVAIDTVGWMDQAACASSVTAWVWTSSSWASSVLRAWTIPKATSTAMMPAPTKAAIAAHRAMVANTLKP